MSKCIVIGCNENAANTTSICRSHVNTWVESVAERLGYYVQDVAKSMALELVDPDFVDAVRPIIYDRLQIEIVPTTCVFMWHDSMGKTVDQCEVVDYLEQTPQLRAVLDVNKLRARDKRKIRMRDHQKRLVDSITKDGGRWIEWGREPSKSRTLGTLTEAQIQLLRESAE